MKYTKQIIFLILINLIIVFLSIYLGNLTRKLELTNNLIKNDILKQKEQLSINMIEFSFYNNPDYIKKLHNIYFSFEDKDIDKKIISFSNISNLKDENVILVNLKSN